MTINTHFRRWGLWKPYRKEAEKVKQVCVSYSFRHRYAKAAHARGCLTKNIAEAMGHTKEVHDANYGRFMPDGTTEMFKEVNKKVAA